MTFGKDLAPLGKLKAHLVNRKLGENKSEYFSDISLVKLGAVNECYGRSVFFLYIGSKSARLIALGPFRIQNYCKGLSYFTKLLDYPFLCHKVVFSRNIAYSAVCGYEYGYC